MPIPKPNVGESEKDYLDRCMGNDTILSEYPTTDQRVAVCLGKYNEGKMEEQQFETGQLDIVAEIKATEEDEGKGYFKGYASVFGNKDLGNDVVEMGAFTKSLMRKKPNQIKMLFQHDTKEVIGVYNELREDKNGLYVEGQLALGTQKGREVYELMKMGAIDGLSVGYRVDQKGYHYDDKSKRRHLKEVDLMEISAVTFPMNPKARVRMVKAENVREWETFLREEGGLSRSESKVAASAVQKALDQREVGDGNNELISAINNLTNILNKGD